MCVIVVLTVQRRKIIFNELQTFELKVITLISEINLPQVNVQYRWKTLETGCSDLVKGNHDHLIEVKITVLKEKKFWDFDN